MTALVVKVLSLVAERQIVPFGEKGRSAQTVPLEHIRHPVSYLLSVQEADGSFGDPNPVLHRGVLVISIGYMLECANTYKSIKWVNKFDLTAKLSPIFNIGWRRPKSIHDGFYNTGTLPLPSISAF